MRLIDADVESISLASQPKPWKILLDTAADKGGLLQQAQPELVKRETGTSITIEYDEFAQLVVSYILVRATEDLFSQFWPAEHLLAKSWSALSGKIENWSKCEKGVLRKRMDAAYERCSDKTVFTEDDDDWPGGDDLSMNPHSAGQERERRLGACSRTWALTGLCPYLLGRNPSR